MTVTPGVTVPEKEESKFHTSIFLISAMQTIHSDSLEILLFSLSQYTLRLFNIEKSRNKQ